MGRSLDSLPVVNIKFEDGHEEVVPQIIFLLTMFFEINEEHFQHEGLFRVNGDRNDIEKLSIHLQSGDFSIL